VKVGVGLGQHERLLSYEPTFRPITVEQPLKGSKNRKGALQKTYFIEK